MFYTFFKKYKKLIFIFEKMSDIITINVGGTKFTTTKTTLQTSEYFKALFTRWNTNNEIFVDRDPIAFTQILNYLRDINNKIDIKYKNEVDFYGIKYKFEDPIIKISAIGTRYEVRKSTLIQLPYIKKLLKNHNVSQELHLDITP